MRRDDEMKKVLSQKYKVEYIFKPVSIFLTNIPFFQEQYEFVEQAIRDNLAYFGKLAQELHSKRTMTNIEIEKVFTECKSEIAADLPSYKLFGDLSSSGPHMTNVVA
eukprot:sb/3477744/